MAKWWVTEMCKRNIDLCLQFYGGFGRPFGALMNISGTNYLTITFRRRVPVFDLQYLPRTTNALNKSWNTDAVQIGVPVNDGDGTETVT